MLHLAANRLDNCVILQSGLDARRRNLCSMVRRGHNRAKVVLSVKPRVVEELRKRSGATLEARASRLVLNLVLAQGSDFLRLKTGPHPVQVTAVRAFGIDGEEVVRVIAASVRSAAGI